MSGISFHNEERPATRAIVLCIEIQNARAGRSAAARLEEVKNLAAAIDLEVVACDTVTLSKIVPATYLGRGKVEELKAQVRALDCELIIFDGQLSPGQQRNLERAWEAKVLDRTGLILEIFGRRAQTREGSLQVELAHLEYQKTRLVRSWTHLERQRGGFGFLGGPGETQIEADRRVIRDRIAAIKKQISAIERTRGLHRKARRRVPYPIVALVGYTNAGKSTLFNYLTSAGVFAEDLLFATLDPTMRQVTLPNGRKIILSDTVGFISELPTMLVAAFRATLEEVLEADIILHVRDVSHPESQLQARDVYAVLSELGLSTAQLDKVVEFWNKVDLLNEAGVSILAEKCLRQPNALIGSAATGQGIDDLLKLLEARLAEDAHVFQVNLGVGEGADLAWVYANGEVLQRHDGAEGNVSLIARFPHEKVNQAKRRLKRRLSSTDPGALLTAAE